MIQSARITLVILTHNRRAEVLENLSHSVALPDRAPVIVVDNASTDGTAESIERYFPDVVLLREHTNRGAMARNRGVLAAKTPYVALADDDCQWQPHSLTRAADLFDQDNRISVLCGKVMVGPGNRTDPTSLLMARSPLGSCGRAGRRILGFMAGASALRVEDFLCTGGFCERLFIGGEEELVALDLAALGRQMAFCPHLVIRHFPSARRDSGQRHLLLARNSIWIGWMRLSPLAALRRTIAVLLSTPAPRRRVLMSVVRGLGWALQQRRVIPSGVDEMRRRAGRCHNL